MGKYRSVAKVNIPKSDGPHVIWRGIGCLLMIFIPLISIAAGVETVKYGLAHGWAIPYELLGRPALPGFFYQSSGLLILFGPLTRIDNFYAYLAFSVLFTVALGGLISLVYAFAYRFVAPPRYGPLDEPPPRIKTKKYTR